MGKTCKARDMQDEGRDKRQEASAAAAQAHLDELDVKVRRVAGHQIRLVPAATHPPHRPAYFACTVLVQASHLHAPTASVCLATLASAPRRASSHAVIHPARVHARTHDCTHTRRQTRRDHWRQRARTRDLKRA